MNDSKSLYWVSDCFRAKEVMASDHQDAINQAFGVKSALVPHCAAGFDYVSITADGGHYHYWRRSTLDRTA